MSDLIRRTELLESFDPKDDDLLDAISVRYFINSASTVEAVPVVHGKWIHPDGAQCETRACSICENQVTMDFDRKTLEPLFKGCPYCFARMDL